LLLWFLIPPTVLYLYSLVSYPIFGPARYTVFVAPAFLVLVAAGLRYIPAVARFPLAIVLSVISASSLGPLVYDPELKADWRDFARTLSRSLDEHPGQHAVVIVASPDAGSNVEVETARYYLPRSCAVVAASEAASRLVDDHDADAVDFAVGSRKGKLAAEVPDRLGPYRFYQDQRYPGLAIFRGRLTYHK
jgi:hypothetical protein